ncbi:putative urease accessory protein UreF-like [Exophiala dermatitidis]
MDARDADALRGRILDLEAQLQTTKALLRRIEGGSGSGSGSSRDKSQSQGQGTPFSSSSSIQVSVSLPLGPSTHNLMLLSDSALPLGSFAYSSGLESFLAHHKQQQQQQPPHGRASGQTSSQTPLSLFHKFLKLSIQSIAWTNVPYVLAAFRDPLDLMDLDNDLDASTPCTVARRASVAQGRALLSVWEKAFAASAGRSPYDDSNSDSEAAAAIEVFAKDLKLSALSTSTIKANGHLAPLWGVVSLALGLNLEESAYLFLLNHAKAVVSAAVRASVMGPYMAQTVLASRDLQDLIRRSLETVWFLQPDDAGQVVPAMDLWVGRHEMLYSRIFNS